MRNKKYGQLFWPIFEASIIASLVFSIVAYLIRLDFLSQAFVFIFFSLTASLLLVEKWLVMLYLRGIRRQGFNLRVVLIVGSGPRARDFAHSIETHPEMGVEDPGFHRRERDAG